MLGLMEIHVLASLKVIFKIIKAGHKPDSVMSYHLSRL